MPLPPVSSERIDEALAQFDRDDRPLPTWQGWEERESYKYALSKNGKFYPPKQIVALATGIPNAEFSGGTEANTYLQKRGFKIEALGLPTKGEVKVALHDLLLAQAPAPIEPNEAYELLANQFSLPKHLREMILKVSNENSWQNRVRQARRDLVAEKIIDPSEHGQWQLLTRQYPAVWVEKSLTKDRPDRTDGDHAVGHALWSPLRSQDGADIYQNMRLVQPNDIILHLTDNSGFSGISQADSRARPDFVGIENTAWAGQPCYRVQLRDLTPLIPPFAREELFSNQNARDRLVEIRKAHRNLFYDPNLNLHQGGYLTAVPEQLVKLLDEVYSGQAGHHLFGSLPMPSAPPIADAEYQQPKHDKEEFRRVWLYAPGQDAKHWDEFRDAGIAGIGWDYVGDLSGCSDAEATKALMNQTAPEPQSLVNANQCFDFSHRMMPGDWVFAKRGRREIIGFGKVKSDYRFEPDRAFYRHIRDVEWEKSGTWPTATHRLLSMKTLTEITDNEILVDELEQLIGLSDTALPPALSVKIAPEYSVENFSTETAIAEETIAIWLSRLKRKQHLIFQGPPGTGKTYVADKLARLLISKTHGIIETVQFHPSYGYEDFMHGIRPVVQDGQMTFMRMPGRFLQFCKNAQRITDGSPCVLIIDEINRGNLARIFGELMYLLEYRDKTIPLAGEEKLFGIPTNVYIIGTMNTADRSIAVVDHALRRRFSFIHLAPDYDVLRTQLETNGLAAEDLLKALQTVNAVINDPNYEIGISFFLKDGAALPSTLRDIWEGEIEPYLEEYFYDQPSKLEPLRWKTLSTGILASWNQ